MNGKVTRRRRGLHRVGEILPMPSIPWVLGRDLEFCKIRGLARFWDAPAAADRQQDLETAGLRLLSGCRHPLALVLVYERPVLHAGWIAAPEAGLAAALRGAYPDIRLEIQANGFKNLLAAAPPFQAALVMSGNPSIALDPEADRPHERYGLDSLVRALSGFSRWLYLVPAFPVQDSEQQAILQLLYQWEAEIRAAHLRPGTALERNNPAAEAALERVLAAKAKTEEGLRIGMWRVFPVLFLDTVEALEPAAGAVRSLFAGPDSKPEPFHSVTCIHSVRAAGVPAPRQWSLLNSRELARLVHLPREEAQGYPVREYAPLSVHQQSPAGSRQLLVGTLLTDPRTPVGIDAAHLAKHLLIAGTTGSGKTTSCLALLLQAWLHHRIPFLVLETGEKREWTQALRRHLGADLHRFTPGSEDDAPLHLDLLHVPTGVSVESHIQHLMRIFKSAFPLPPPTPYILEDTLYQFYEKRGWDVAANRKTSTGQPLIFEDLVQLLRRLLQHKYHQYEGVIRGNIEGALLARLDSFLRGGMRNFAAGDADYEQRWFRIMQRPTVLELGSLGDPEKKALAVLYLLYLVMSAARKDQADNPHRLHLTVVEEAHRVLTHRDPSGHPDLADTQAALVEEFANALAEIRYAGEGLIILDQQPSRLSSAVLANTNYKLCHRLNEEKEVCTMAGAAGLDEQRQRRLLELPPGEAVWMPEGGGAFPIRVRPYGS